MTPDEALAPLNAADTQASEKEGLGEKGVLHDVMQKVEELLGVLGKVAGVRHGTRGATAVESGGLEVFLQMNAEEGFDLETLNSLDTRALEREARGEKRILREVMQKVEELMPRLHSETEDATFIGSILRAKTLYWYHHSPSDPDWAEKMAPRWGGIFHESRVPGGRLSPTLSTRLENLHMECEKASGWAVALSRVQARAESLIARVPLFKVLLRGSKRPLQPLMPQVAQAYLDDLAARGRSGDRHLPMERLSRLARRIGSPEMNFTLGVLFPQDGGEPFVVLDPHLHVDIEGVMISPPPPRVVGDAITYEIVPAKGSLPLPSGAPGGETTEASSPPLWDRKEITKDDWNGLFGLLQKQKARLDPPPIENYRNRESYLGLRELILEDSEVRTAFRAVHWRGKPSGLALLDELLCEGTFAPEVETDCDYLEAELTHLETGDPDQRPVDGRWNLGHGWTVVRGLAPGDVRTYRADHGHMDTLQAAASGPAPSAEGPPGRADPAAEGRGGETPSLDTLGQNQAR